MSSMSKGNAGKLVLFNFLIVAIIGVIMRYKIGFNFAYFDQKNLQHAHAYFAFSGWVSQSFLIMFLSYLQEQLNNKKIILLNKLIWINLIIAYSMLVSFAISGYSVCSIVLTTFSLGVFYFIAIISNKLLKSINQQASFKWFRAAFLFGIISSLGTLCLSVLMATKQFNQHLYLASVYWYLHFQYNGYFFFMCIAFLNNYLHKIEIRLSSKIFVLLFTSTFITYGLSVLWLKLPLLAYTFIAAATVLQTVGIVMLLLALHKQKFLQKINSSIVKYLFQFLFVSVCIKYLLQAGSTISAINKFAFGFRNIVIAYLHLVLLAIISISIICFLLINKFIIENKQSKMAIILLSVGIFLNELILCMQGLASISYIVIPYANEMLFGISVIMLLSILSIILSQKRFITTCD